MAELILQYLDDDIDYNMKSIFASLDIICDFTCGKDISQWIVCEIIEYCVTCGKFNPWDLKKLMLTAYLVFGKTIIKQLEDNGYLETILNTPKMTEDDKKFIQIIGPALPSNNIRMLKMSLS